MTLNKGIEGKLDADSEDEEMMIDPEMAVVIEKARDYLSNMLPDQKVFIPNKLDPTEKIENQVLLAQRLKGKVPKNGKILKVKSLDSTPAKYM